MSSWLSEARVAALYVTNSMYGSRSAHRSRARIASHHAVSVCASITPITNATCRHRPPVSSDSRDGTQETVRRILVAIGLRMALRPYALREIPMFIGGHIPGTTTIPNANHIEQGIVFGQYSATP